MIIKIGKRKIGENNPTFIVAELGINHNGSIQAAKKMILAAKKAGADAVKLQSFITKDFVGDKNLMFTYKSNGKKVTESQYQMFKRYELNYRVQKELFAFAKKIDIILFSTPQDSDFKMVDFLCSQEINMPAIKVGSDDLTNLPMLKYYAKKNKPIIISTGMATFEEINDAVNTIKKQGNRNLVILKCTSLYPTPTNLANLAQIKTLQNKFKYIIGYSDHTAGFSAAVVAVVLGAKVIEKHFTLNKNSQGPDHWFSADVCEFTELVKKVREAESLIGNKDFILSQQEMKMKKDCRRSIIVIDNIKKGDKISHENIDVKRPGTGLPPKFLLKFLNKKAIKDYPIGYIFNMNDLKKYGSKN